MFVSRKNLPLIHFVPSEFAASINMAKPWHQGIILGASSRSRRELFEPFAKSSIECLSLRTGNSAGFLDQALVSA